MNEQKIQGEVRGDLASKELSLAQGLGFWSSPGHLTGECGGRKRPVCASAQRGDGQGQLQSKNPGDREYHVPSPQHPSQHAIKKTRNWV